MKYRVKRQDDHGHVFTVPHEGLWYEHLAEATAIKRALERGHHKQDYWIEDEEGRVVSPSGDSMESWDVFIVKVLQRIQAKREEAIQEGRDSSPYDEMRSIR